MIFLYPFFLNDPPKMVHRSTITEESIIKYQWGKEELKDMTEKAMRLKRIDDINERLKKKYKNIYLRRIYG